MRKGRVLVSSLLPGKAHELLAQDFHLTLNEGAAYSYEELLEKSRDKDAIVSILTNKIDSNFFESCPEMKIVANVAVGYDNIDIEAAERHGVIVCNTPGVLTETTADLAFALILSTARRITESEKFLRDGLWQRFALDLLLGVDVHRKTLGLIGFGRIGQSVARRARGFSMNVLYTQRNRVAEDIEEELQASYVEMDELLSKSDFVSIHCPLSAETTHLIGSEQLQKMKSDAILINTSRGPIVDEKALAEALNKGFIRAAGLDVFEREPEVEAELLKQKNVVLIPHIGSATIETRSAMARLAVESVISAFAGRLPANTVNKKSWTEFEKRARQIGLLPA